MDKQKIVVIVGDDFTGLSPQLIAMGEALHMDIEAVNIKDTLQGKSGWEPVAFVDEYTMPKFDFDKLEKRAMGCYQHPQLDQIPRKLRDHERYPSLPDFYRPYDVGADHPSRKREPKGPRGKWGKL